MSTRVSIVIATMNRPADLAAALTSLSAQTCLPLEVIVVDQSTNGLSKEVAQAANRAGPLAERVLYVHQPVPSSARARNRGVAESAGDLISFIDDDVELAPDYYQKILEAFAANPQCGGIGGSVQNIPSFGGLKWKLRKAMMRVFLLSFWNGRMTPSGFGYPIYDREIDRVTRVEMLHGCNMTIRRNAMGEEWFDEWFMGYSYREDAELTYRLARTSEVLMIPDAKLVHNESPANRLSRPQRRRMEIDNVYYVWRKHREHTLWNRLLFRYSLAGLLLIAWLETAFRRERASDLQETWAAIRALRL
jgi:GT2 family glycosyltransferase